MNTLEDRSNNHSSPTLQADTPLPWAQFWAVTRCECLLQWRQRGWWVATFPILAMTALVMFAQQGNLPPDDRTLDSENITRLLEGIQPILHIFGMLLYPILFAETLPKDRQWNVRELLGTLPVDEGTFLAGKLAGTALSVTFSMVIIQGFLGGLARVLFGPFDLGRFLSVSLLGGLSIALTATLLSVLVAAGQPTRRRAILIGAVFGVVFLVLLGIGFGDSIRWHDYLNPSRSLTLRYYVQQMVSGTEYAAYLGTPIAIEHVLAATLIGFAEVVLGWFIVRRWLRHAA